MKKGRIANTVFVLTGSFVLIVLCIIVTMNFMKDARVFQQTVATAVQDTEAKLPEKAEEKKAAAGAKEKKAAVPEKKSEPGSTKTETKEKTEEKPKQEAANAGAPAEKIKVEIINYSGIKRAAEQIKETLEASGYEVSAGNERTNKQVRTEIIERNDKKAGAAVQKLLKIGPVIKTPDPASRFDITIKIGDDYKP